MNVKVFDSNYFETESSLLFICYDVWVVSLLMLLPAFVIASLVFVVPMWICMLLLLAVTAFMIFVTYWKQHVTLVFKGASLCVVNHYGKEMLVYSDVGQEAFGFSQSKREKKLGLGTIYVYGTDYVISGIRNFDAMQQYIRTHFPQKGYN